MKQERKNPNQVSLLLRLLCGGYLVYTAWDLRGAFQDSPLFIVAAIVFAVVGLALGGISLYQLIKTGDFFDKPAAVEEAAEESKDCEEQLDE